MFVLLLNDMRSAHYENKEPVARALTPEALFAYLERESVEPYTETADGKVIVHDTDAVAHNAGETVVEVVKDYRWGKRYRKGGPLEWYNWPMCEMTVERLQRYGYIVECDDRETFMQKMGLDWDRRILPILEVWG